MNRDKGQLLIKINLWFHPGSALLLSSFLLAAVFLNFFRKPQAVQDSFLFSNQFLFRDLAQEFLDKYILVFQENILIHSYIWHILQGPRFKMEDYMSVSF